MAEITDFDPVDANNTTRWPEGMQRSQINNSARADEGILARWFRDTNGSITSSGSANAYAITSNRTISSLVNNTLMAWTANHTNTGTATLALNGLTAKAIKRPNGDALVAGDIVSGQTVVVIYKSSPDEWRMLSPGAFVASDTLAGAIEIAVQAEMEAAADMGRAVVPGRQQFHPGHPKAWIVFNGTGTPAIIASYGMDGATPITDNGVGNYTLKVATPFSSAGAYSIVAWCRSPEAGRLYGVTADPSDTKDADEIQIRVRKDDGAANDSAEITVLFFGDQ